MKINVLGVQINTDTRNAILFLIKKLLAENRKITIVTPYSEMIVRAQRDREFKAILNSATFALPDGIGILWTANFLSLFRPGEGQGRGQTIKILWRMTRTLSAIVFNASSLRFPIREKISGSDFIWDLARLAGERGYSIFLLGGFNDAAERAANKLKSKFPDLRIAGFYSPPREEGIGEVIVRQINSSRADFLFVALGPVAQEKWIAANLNGLDIKLAVGLGGTFDYLAGKRPPAPQIWRKIGLEWLWRLLTQPWRLWRIGKGIFGLIWYTVRAKV